jgi:cephalosporin hydroxylase
MISIHEDKLVVSDDNKVSEYDIGSPEAFRILSQLWLRSGWDNKYVYSFTWLGRPLIQLPEDMLRLQEVIFSIQPDVIVETGVAHGGSLVFYASLCRALGRGRVIGIDVEVRPPNRQAIEAHPLFELITLVEGDSIAPDVVRSVKSEIKSTDTVLVLLDSCHTKEHVRAELEAYAEIVNVGSYIVAMDGIMQNLVGAPRTNPDWFWNNPQQAAREFVAAHPQFVIESPEFMFNEGAVREPITYWPNGFIKRIA